MEKTISIPVPEGKKAVWVNDVLTLIDEEKPKNIMERVKTFEDACNELGDMHPFVRAFKEVYTGAFFDEDIKAYIKLRIICAALNEGWSPQFVEGEYRYYPWYYLYTKEELDNMSEDERAKVWLWGGSSRHGSYCGLGVSNSDYVWSYSYSDFSARLAFKTSELAKYAGEQFKEIYADFMLIRNPEGYVINIKSDAPEND